jgi:hypothetical protein
MPVKPQAHTMQPDIAAILLNFFFMFLVVLIE